MKPNRRDFIKSAAGAAALASVGLPVARAGKGPKARVVLVRDEAVFTGKGELDKTVLTKMLDRAVAKLMSQPTAAAAWRKLIKPSDTVGIKSNEWNKLRTPPELEQGLVDGAKAAGVPADRISVADRSVLRDPVFQKATALINVRPMRTHAWSGVGSLIKNYIMFVPNPSAYHDDTCADLGAIWNLPVVKGKTRLNVLVMLTPLFHGEGYHHFNKKYLWPYNGLLVSQDPVAADATGVRILEAKRKEHFGQEKPILPEPKHIPLAAARHKLGVADPGQIDLIEV